MRWTRLALVPVLALTFACSGDDSEQASPTEATTDAPDIEDAFLEQFEESKAHQFARLYARLHPAQQELVSEAGFLACAEDQFATLPADTTVEVTETYPEDYTIPGVGERVSTMAVTYTMEAGDETAQDTIHLMDVDGSWRWFMADPAQCMGDV
jgi:hypothetical protein